MARGGYRPGAGRKKKTGAEAVDAAVVSAQKQGVDVAPRGAGDMTPLEYMLSVMNDSTVPSDRRDRMAIAAAPFVHKRAGEGGKKEEREDAARKAFGGKFSPQQAPHLRKLAK